MKGKSILWPHSASRDHASHSPAPQALRGDPRISQATGVGERTLFFMNSLTKAIFPIIICSV
ncbi:hypothetical protein E2C01_085818 [Portunus trituberculatus]|uniref:Uncharacterized protein n=1 Tax=Portunus trituberculatus TaxID=210409 RepID=A0A5B7J9W9_PORTR|nr:hypothetical protein [Portunus trituberculatus]